MDENGNMTATKPAKPITVGSVGVTPQTATVKKGDTGNFSATVYNGSGIPINGEATWDVEGESAGGTNVNQTGELYIADNETAQSVTVRATSKENSQISGMATVTIEQEAVTAVTVTTNGNTVDKGTQKDFTADIAMNYGNFSGNITWNVNGGSDSGITNNGQYGGKLAVGQNETATSLTIMATAGGKTSPPGTVTVADPATYTVKDAIDGTNIEGKITIDGIEWYVFRKDNGYAMLVAAQAQERNVVFDSSAPISEFYETSNLQDLMTRLYENTSDIKKIAVIPNLGADPEARDYATQPTSAPAGGQTKDIFFALSYKDGDDFRKFPLSVGKYDRIIWLRTKITEAPAFTNCGIRVRSADVDSDMSLGLKADSVASVVPAVWVKYQ